MNTFGQNNREINLINAFVEYKNVNEFEDSLKFNQNLLQLNIAIENALKDENILNFEKFKKITDSLNVNYTIKKSENNDFLLFTMSDNMFHWNYIVQNNVIVLKNHKWHEYFTEIHNLNENEFLLIKQKDDLVFSCNYASVFKKSNNSYKMKKVFRNKSKLTVCNFTNIEDGNGHFSRPVKKISFDYKNKTISYGSCRNAENEKRTLSKANYKNGKFKIEDCDERSGFIEVE